MLSFSPDCMFWSHKVGSANSFKENDFWDPLVVSTGFKKKTPLSNNDYSISFILQSACSCNILIFLTLIIPFSSAKNTHPHTPPHIFFVGHLTWCPGWAKEESDSGQYDDTAKTAYSQIYYYIRTILGFVRASQIYPTSLSFSLKGITWSRSY